MSLRQHHPLKGERDFVWRGEQPTRVEALSDMVFAFAVTLLVVSSDPPRSFPELTEQLWGFPGFAAAFAILLIVWHAHYIFFRRYAIEDGYVTWINAGLLFLILFFVYPLKFLATMLSEFVHSLAMGAPRAPFTLDEARDTLTILSFAYAAVFFMFALLYGHARTKADSLALTPYERASTRFAQWHQWVHVLIGASVVVFTNVTPPVVAPFGGFLYCLIGPLVYAAGAITMPRAKPGKTPPTAEQSPSASQGPA
jgi:uncharacterized membrane protein